ncbi:DivIVA domain-containing protein [Nafulsella turpanensis]|uniref:DivIVA domain-containing protein n=1 Tax=Nafulsella turpanensis TaxID=1265690 RepID=UPI000349296F|nr:DivIVA domain-containing protein [Nafulsella turpanensis]
MKVTPLEIRQKTFEKEFRGFDREEVNAFLLSLSQEWERVVEDQKELRYKLEVSEKEVEKLREVENSLFKTLKTAEATGNNMVEQANKQAELKVREAELKAETILNNARSRAKEIIDSAEEKADNIIGGMEERVRQLEQNYRMLESYRENLLNDLVVTANSTLERVEQAEKKIRKHDIEGLVHRADKAAKELKAERNRQPLETEPPAKQKPAPEENNSNSEKSFFDDI